MAMDPFQGLSAEARRRGYDPLAIMAGLGLGQQRAGELAMERQRRQAEAEQQAAQMQMQARQMTLQEEQAQRQLAESQAQRQLEMERLGMTKLQQEQEAALQGRRLDQELAMEQRRIAESALEREARRVEQEAIRTAAQREADIARQFEASKLQSEYNIRYGKGGELDRLQANALALAAAQQRQPKEPNIPASLLQSAVERKRPALDEKGIPMTDEVGNPLLRASTPEEIVADLNVYADALGIKRPTLNLPAAPRGGAGGGGGGGGLAALRALIERQAAERRAREAKGTR